MVRIKLPEELNKAKLSSKCVAGIWTLLVNCLTRGQDFTPPIHTHVRCDDFTCFAYHVVQQLLLSQSFLPQWKQQFPFSPLAHQDVRSLASEGTAKQLLYCSCLVKARRKRREIVLTLLCETKPLQWKSLQPANMRSCCSSQSLQLIFYSLWKRSEIK